MKIPAVIHLLHISGIKLSVLLPSERLSHLHIETTKDQKLKKQYHANVISFESSIARELTTPPRRCMIPTPQQALC